VRCIEGRARENYLAVVKHFLEAEDEQGIAAAVKR
jgi:hypothetical protein